MDPLNRRKQSKQQQKNSFFTNCKIIHRQEASGTGGIFTFSEASGTRKMILDALSLALHTSMRILSRRVLYNAKFSMFFN